MTFSLSIPPTMELVVMVLHNVRSSAACNSLHGVDSIFSAIFFTNIVLCLPLFFRLTVFPNIIRCSMSFFLIKLATKYSFVLLLTLIISALPLLRRVPFDLRYAMSKVFLL